MIENNSNLWYTSGLAVLDEKVVSLRSVLQPREPFCQERCRITTGRMPAGTDELLVCLCVPVVEVAAFPLAGHEASASAVSAQRVCFQQDENLSMSSR